MIDLKKYIENKIESDVSQSLDTFYNHKSKALSEALKNTNAGDFIEGIYVVDLDGLDMTESTFKETYTYNNVPIMECDKPTSKVTHDGLKTTMILNIGECRILNK